MRGEETPLGEMAAHFFPKITGSWGTEQVVAKSVSKSGPTQLKVQKAFKRVVLDPLSGSPTFQNVGVSVTVQGNRDAVLEAYARNKESMEMGGPKVVDILPLPFPEPAPKVVEGRGGKGVSRTIHPDRK